MIQRSDCRDASSFVGETAPEEVRDEKRERERDETKWSRGQDRPDYQPTTRLRLTEAAAETLASRKLAFLVGFNNSILE